jgi:hypothetical protein
VFFDPTICSEACSSVVLVVLLLLLLPADSLKALDLDRPIREADIEGTEIPQCSGRLLGCSVLSFRSEARGQQFGSAPRT